MHKENLTIKETFTLAFQNHKKNNFKIAEDLYKEILKTNPNHFGSIFYLGSLLVQTKNFDLAKSLLMKAIKIEPAFADAYNNLGIVFNELGEDKKSIDYFKIVIKINPNSASAYNNLGNAFRKLNELHEAIRYFQKAIEIQPQHLDAHNNLGHTYKELGKFKKSIACYENATKCQSEDLFSFYNLSKLNKKILNLNLKKKIVEIMKKDNPGKKNLTFGNFLLSNYELQSKNYKEEFNCLVKGHIHYFESEKEKFKRDVDYWLNVLPTSKELVNLNKYHIKIKKNEPVLKPIFIVGVPRCGSTLIEKIIASGGQYIPIGEEAGVVSAFVDQEIIQKQSINLNLQEFRTKIIKRYEQKGLIEEKSGYMFTDKSLDNFFYINLIKKIFPQAKMINCKRNAIASIMSTLKTNLIDIAWAHNLEHIFKYFDIYYKTIQTYKKTFPNFIYELQFEQFVNDTENEAKKLMKFCELPWDKKCLEFYKRKDLISKTASNVQIRKPIYKDSLNKYSPYKKFLFKYGKEYSWFN